MDDKLPSDKVKYDVVIPFPGYSVKEPSPVEERLARLETDVAELKSTVVSLLAVIAGRESRPEIKAPVEAPRAPESRPLPEEDKTISRLALCNELVRLLIELNRETVFVGTPKLASGNKTGKPRVHFLEDNTFLYFDSSGRIHEGRSEKKNPVARRVLKQLYAMRDFLPSPGIQAALLKSQFNAALLD
jgi:hypothetical protein